MKTVITVSAIFVCLFISFEPSEATTLLVDPIGGPYTAIQLALNAASSGDTVLVVPGTYSGTDNINLDFGGEDIVLLSESGADTTIIDAENAGGAVWFHTGETGAAVMDGFTITRAPIGSPIRIEGGASPTIRNCVIRNNDVTSNSGGGVFIHSSSPTFNHCIIAENSNTNHAGGVFVRGGSPNFIGCAIIGNVTDGRGGGCWVDSLASLSLEGCTITGNRANESQSGFDGGGMIFTGAAIANVNLSILWGNRGDQGDDLIVAGPSSISFSCSVVDSSGTAGAGSITYEQGNTFEDPHFCLPAYCRDYPWQDGHYTLAVNSPCLPANNTCEQLIGAFHQGCDSVTVWTGAAGNTDWDNPLNWSTGRVPGSADHVQLTRGNVELSTAANIGLLTQCPESSESDTLIFTTDCLLAIYCWSLDKRACPEKSVFSGFVDSDTVDTYTAEKRTGVITLENEGLISSSGEFNICDLTLTGPGTWTNQGRVTFGGNCLSLVETSFINESGTLDSSFAKEKKAPLPRGVFLRNGTANFTGSFTNRGQLTVKLGATLEVNGAMANQPDGILTLVGDIGGTGTVTNLGLIEKEGPVTSSVSASLINDRRPGPSLVGNLQVMNGSLEITGALTNSGEVTVAAGGTLDFDGGVDNLASGVLILRGELSGTGTLANFGLLKRMGPGTSSVTPLIHNRFDTSNGKKGLTLVTMGTLSVADFTNSGRLIIPAGSTFIATSSFTNLFHGEITGSGTFDVSAAVFTNFGSIGPGTSAGALDFIGDFVTSPTSAIVIELAGTDPGLQYDQLNITGTASYGGAMHVRLENGFMPDPGDTFHVITVNEPLPKATGDIFDSGFDCLSGIQLVSGLYLDPVELPDGFLLVAKDSLITNSFPVAMADTFATAPNNPVTLMPLANDMDPDGDDLNLANLLTTTTLGTAFVDSGSTTVSYLPPPNYIGSDSLVYQVTDCNGAVDAAVILVEISGPSEVTGDGTIPVGYRLYPNAPNPFNPTTRIRFDLPEPTDARLVVYDLRGRRVRMLADGYHSAGIFDKNWQGRDDRNRPVAAGIYFARLETPRFTEIRKMVLVR